MSWQNELIDAIKKNDIKKLKKFSRNQFKEKIGFTKLEESHLDPTTIPQGTAIMFACAFGNIETIDLIIKKLGKDAERGLCELDGARWNALCHLSARLTSSFDDENAKIQALELILKALGKKAPEALAKPTSCGSPLHSLCRSMPIDVNQSDLDSLFTLFLKALDNNASQVLTMQDGSGKTPQQLVDENFTLCRKYPELNLEQLLAKIQGKNYKAQPSQPITTNASRSAWLKMTYTGGDKIISKGTEVLVLSVIPAKTPSDVIEYNCKLGTTTLKIFGDYLTFDKPRAVVSVLPQEAEKLFELGRQAHNNHELTKALDYFMRAIELNPKELKYHFSAGLVHIFLEQFHAAMAKMNEVLSLDFHHSDAHFYNGYAKYSLMQYQNAISDFDLAVNFGKKDREVFSSRAFAKYMLNDLEGALSDLERSLELSPKDEKCLDLKKTIEEALASQPKKDNTVTAIYSYSAKNEGELSINKGDKLEVVDDKGNWWLCRKAGKEGKVPSNYLEKAEGIKKSVSSSVTVKKSSSEVGLETRTSGQAESNNEPARYDLNQSDIPLQSKILEPARTNQKLRKEGCFESSGLIELNLSIEYTELKFDKRLGQGAYGEVYSGTWRYNQVAIKKLLGTNYNEDAIRELQQEAQVLAKVRSDYVVQIKGLAVQAPNYCLVMELMPKGNLYELLQSEQPLGWTQRYQLAQDIGIGLHHLHAENILHRDLKSLNVLLTNDYRAKLCDFGLAKIKTTTKTQSRMTQTNSGGEKSVGTLPWMAPELFGLRPKYSTKSDIYAYGMIMWELSARRVPYEDVVSEGELRDCIKNGDREEIPDNTPPSYAKLIKFCWAQKPEERPEVEKVLEELEGCKNQLRK
ncbi:MAG: protein kinase [Gammaproteobacteria bacterium]